MIEENVLHVLRIRQHWEVCVCMCLCVFSLMAIQTPLGWLQPSACAVIGTSPEAIRVI